MEWNGCGRTRFGLELPAEVDCVFEALAMQRRLMHQLLWNAADVDARAAQTYRSNANIRVYTIIRIVKSCKPST